MDGKYYQMNFTKEGILSIDRTPKELDEEIEEEKIEIVNDYNTEILSNAVIDENRIILTGGNGQGSTTLTVKYGKYDASCEVKIADKINSITATPLTLDEDTSEEIKVTVTPNDAIAKLKYTTTDNSKISVNEQGMVTAKVVENGKIKDTATVIITDERTGKSATCNVTIESLVGRYIEYDVSYEDMRNRLKFTKENGWRLLKYTKNSDGTYANVELISTGLPTVLRYDPENNTENSKNGWWEENVSSLNSFKNALRS